MSRFGLFSLVVAGALATSAIAPAQAPEIFTATAVEGDLLTDPEGERSVAIAFVIDRFTTEAERTAVLAALQEGTPALHTLLAMSPDIGRIVVAGRETPLKFIYGPPEGRITLLANEPLAFRDPGRDTDKVPTEFNFAFAILDFSLPGFAAGKINPAAKIGINSAGQIETQDYGAAIVRLSNVQKKSE